MSVCVRTPRQTSLRQMGHLLLKMKSAEVQTLGAVALHATTDSTDDESIVCLGRLNWAIV